MGVLTSLYLIQQTSKCVNNLHCHDSIRYQHFKTALNGDVISKIFDMDLICRSLLLKSA